VLEFPRLEGRKFGVGIEEAKTCLYRGCRVIYSKSRSVDIPSLFLLGSVVVEIVKSVRIRILLL
jgi:hypothetical protein